MGWGDDEPNCCPLFSWEQRPGAFGVVAGGLDWTWETPEFQSLLSHEAPWVGELGPGAASLDLAHLTGLL